MEAILNGERTEEDSRSLLGRSLFGNLVDRFDSDVLDGENDGTASEEVYFDAVSTDYRA